MARIVANWETRGGAYSVQLVCDSEAVEGYSPNGGDVFGGALPRYTAAEYTRTGGLRGEHVFSALDDAAAIERVADRVAAGYYSIGTGTGGVRLPARVAVEGA
jgi:hypothetical protein